MEHANAEQALREAEHALVGIEEQWDKLQSEAEAEDAEAAGAGADMEIELVPARADFSSWSRYLIHI